MDNFRRPKHPSKSRAIDGFISSPDKSQRSGSINNFERMRVPSRNQSASNFAQSEGFHPAQQPVLPQLGSSAVAGTAGLPQAEPLRPRRSWRNRRKDAQREGKKKRNWRKISLRTAGATLLIVLVAAGYMGWKFNSNTSKIFGGGNILGFLNDTKLKGEETGRVNILLAGNSEDDPGHSGALLTDSIMLISIDTTNNTAFMMSIPRDLWVTYGPKNCSVGQQGKINAAYVCGEQIDFKEEGYPEGGMGLLEKIVEQNFGIDIHYYARINYSAFRDSVNAVGGIDVTIKTNDSRGIYDGNISKAEGGPLKLSNGTHHLDGQQALNLARARCDTVCYGFDGPGEFIRSEHQRQMLVALKDKALSLGVLSNPTKITSLMDAAGNNIKTDFKTNEATRLYDLAQKIQNNNITSIGLADDDVKLVQTAPINGLSAVRPVAGVSDFSEIKAFIKRLTSSDPIVRENATVVVLNGSGVSGLGQTKSKVLTDKGLNVDSVANASKQYPSTTVVALTNNKSATKSYLEQTYQTTATTDTVAHPDAKNYDADFVIIIGSNETSTSQN